MSEPEKSVARTLPRHDRATPLRRRKKKKKILLGEAMSKDTPSEYLSQLGLSKRKRHERYMRLSAPAPSLVLRRAVQKVEVVHAEKMEAIKQAPPTREVVSHKKRFRPLALMSCARRKWKSR